MTANGSSDPDRVRADIQKSRDDLGATVQALAAKTDVKARSQDRATEVKSRIEQEMKGRTQETRARAAGALQGVRARTGASLGGVARSVRQRGMALGLGTTRRAPAIIGTISGNAPHQDGSIAGRARPRAVAAVRSTIRRRPAIVLATAAAVAAVAVGAVVGRQVRLGPGFAIRRRC
ncbi:DUF3618 domain-containing protein [Micromonospora coerulea]|uniref:DUF3618 domain-containing protein n=1 Tax=Micromonospora coerulea TaxID=47856 RepID=UPI001904FABD|nr:DUF3618 domain-containing protein [Micromonospora veneta]